MKIGLLQGLRQGLDCPHFWPLAVWFFCTFGVFFFMTVWGNAVCAVAFALAAALLTRETLPLADR